MPGNTSNYGDQGGVLQHIGGELDVESGGVLDVKSGATLKVSSTAVTATAAEINKLAGVTAGTATASKAAVLGATKNLDVLNLPVGGLGIGAAGAEVATTVTAAEINALAGQGAIAADFAKLHAVTASAAEVNALTGQGAVTTDIAKLHAITASAADINSGVQPATVGTDGLGRLGVARVTFDPSGTAGLRTVAAHASSVTLPQYATIIGGWYDVNTAFTSAGANDGTVAISVEGANDIVTATAVSNNIYGTIGRKAIIPKFATPESTSVKCTAARAVTFTVAVDALTAGTLTLFLIYAVSAASA